MGVNDFTTDRRDIHFVLHDQLKVSEILGACPAFEEMDQDLIDSVIDAAIEIATDVLWPINRQGDREGCSFDGKGNITTPPGFKEAYAVCAENGYCGLISPEEYGGMGMPQVIGCVVSELFTASNTSFSMYPGLSSSAGNVLANFLPQELLYPFHHLYQKCHLY